MVYLLIILIYLNILAFGLILNLLSSLIDYIVIRAYGCLDVLYCSINRFTFQIRRVIISQVTLPLIDYPDIVYQNNIYLKPLSVVYNSLHSLH